MNKIYLSLLIIMTIVLVVVFYPRKSIKTPQIIVGSTVENNDKLKQDLIIIFTDYRESIYKIKQKDLLEQRGETNSPKFFKTDICVKMAYDLDAFIMRARLAPKAIENKDCHKLRKFYQDLLKSSKRTTKKKPSYQTRLKKDLDYFTNELNKQKWKSDELVRKIKDFKLEINKNRLILRNMSISKKKSEKNPSKCIKTILMHEREFLLTCKQFM